jgi:transposase
VAHARLDDGSGPPACRRPKKSDAETEALGRSRGGFSTKIHALVDALGNPLTFILTPGQAGDCPQAESLLAFCGGEEQKTAIEAVLADKGYDSSDLARHIESEFEAEAVIPSRTNAKHPREIDRELYKDRNKIERFIGRVKHYRRVATRYDKTARNYMAFLHVASIMTLLL